MSVSKLAGFGMIGGGLLLVVWRAHKDGMLYPLLKGGLYGIGIAAFIYTAIWLINGGGQ